MSGAARSSFTTDAWLAAGLSAAAFAFYAATLLPGLGSGDTAEFQRVLPTLDVAHPTGYPLYTLLGWLWSWLPLGTVAWRISLFSAAAAAFAIGALFRVARAIGQSAPVAAGAALMLAASRTFWSQATIAEVYALAALVQALLLLALLRWRAGRWPLWVAGLLAGLGIAHHRTIILMFPGALVFVLLTLWQGRTTARTTPLWRELALAAGALLAGCLFYLYLPLRAPAWLESWRTLLRVIGGSDALGVWLGVNEPWRVAAEHLRELWTRLIVPQFTPMGLVLTLLGLARVAGRDRALAALLALGYLAALVFCVLFFVQDVEVFLLSGHLLMALLIGEGVMLLAGLASRTAKQPWIPALAGTAMLALPLILFAQNLAPIRAANTTLPERAARATLAQELPPGSLLLADWEAVEPLRYLQTIEGVRPDIEVRTLNEDVVRQDVDAALGAGRAAFLLRALPNLGLSQLPAGRLWRVTAAPPQLAITTPSDARWADGIALSGFTLPPGPYRPGEIVPLTLAWAAWQAPAQDYTLFVHLIGPDGTVWGQFDRAPTPPTSQWRPGAPQPGLYGPTLRLDAPPGRYRVLLGWYSYPSLERLALQSGGGAFELGTVEVAPLADLPTPPQP